MGGFGLRVYRIFVASYAWGSFYRERISRYDGIFPRDKSKQDKNDRNAYKR